MTKEEYKNKVIDAVMYIYECPDGFVKGFLNTRWSKND